MPRPRLTRSSTPAASIFITPLAVSALLVAPSVASAAATHGHSEESAVGDFNGDGLLDRVVVEPYDASSRGRVRIYLGDETNGVLDLESHWYFDSEASNYWETAPIELDADSPIFSSQRAVGAAFGTSVTVGDFDDDGRDDIAFGAPGEDVLGRTDAGTVYVLYGKHLIEFPGFNPGYIAASKFQQGVGGILGWLEAYDRFGTALTTGDVNCDGVDDLVIGVPYEDVMVGPDTFANAGAINVIYGSDPAGLTAGDNQYINQEVLGGTTAVSDLFGYSVAVGNFDNQGGGVLYQCNSVAAGAPYKDVSGVTNAGAVYLLPATVNGVELDATYWHQDTPYVLGAAGANEKFGHSLGTIDHGAYDDLWVRVPGEPCGGDMETKYQVFRAGASGLTTLDSLYCSRHEPGIMRNEAGRIVEKIDSYGPYLQYIPHSVTESSDMFVAIHGTPTAVQIGEDPTALAARAARFVLIQRDLIKLAEAESLILIAPGFKSTSFKAGGYAEGHPVGSTSNPGGQSYRELMGRDIQADAWVNLIVDGYAPVGLRETDEIYIYGQSAGAQMVSRYIVRNPARVIKAAINSANTLGRPVSVEPVDPNDPNGPTKPVTWGAGAGALAQASTNFWKDDFSGTVSVSYGYTPDLDDYEAAYSKPIFVNVGALETGFDDEGNFDQHVTIFNRYRQETDAFMSQRDQVSEIEFCVIPNMKHNFIAMLPYALEQMFPGNFGNLSPCQAP